ncbi:MAG: HEAT repeat domain-containing protein [Chloroflexota bacterium]
MTQLTEPLATELASPCFHTAETILERRSEEDFEQLRAVLTDEKADEVAKQNAIMLLGRWGRPEVVPALVAQIPAQDERGLINLVDALGRLGTSEAVTAVLEQSYHPSPDVRRFAAYALERAGTQPALARLREMSRVDEAPFVQARARDLLTRRDSQSE